MLQTILYVKRLEIILIEKNNNSTIINQVIKANFKDSYCFKLYHSLKDDSYIKEIDLFCFFNLLVNSKDCIN